MFTRRCGSLVVVAGWFTLGGLGCTPTLQNSTARIIPVDEAAAVRADLRRSEVASPGGWSPHSRRELPPLERGTVIVVKGTLERRPIELWVNSPSVLSPGGDIEVNDEEGHAQLVVGDPHAYVSNQVDVDIDLSDDGKTANVKVSADHPIIDPTWREEEEFDFNVPVTTLASATPLDVGDLEPKSYDEEVLVDASPNAPPPDTTVESHPRWPLVWAGLGAFAGSYISSVAIAGAAGFPDDSGYYVLPVAGPLIFLGINGYADGEPDGSTPIVNGIVTLMTVGVALLEGAGIGAMALGFGLSEKRVVRTARNVQVVPAAALADMGLSVMGTF